MKNIKIRKANKKDLDALVTLISKLRDYHRRLDRSFKTGRAFRADARKYLKKDLASKNSLILVAEDSGKLTGCCVGRITKPSKVFLYARFGFIFDIYIEPRYRRQRIGQKFMEQEMA